MQCNGAYSYTTFVTLCKNMRKLTSRSLRRWNVFNFFPVPFGTRPLRWFVFSLSDLVNFLFSFFDCPSEEGAHSCLETSWEKSETKWGGSWEKVHNVKIFNFNFSWILMEDSTKKPAKKTAWKNIEASQSYSTFCDTRLHAYLWHVMTLIAVFSTLRLRTLCTFSHEPPQIVG